MGAKFMESKDAKRGNYARERVNLKKALACSFFFEAIVIEYSILEDRTQSVLQYTGLFRKRKDHIHDKLSEIEKLSKSEGNPAFGIFPEELIQRTMAWTKSRNDVIHHLMTTEKSPEEIKETALEGNELVKEFDSAAKKYKRRLIKKGLLSADSGSEDVTE
jgi:hypothetical protein